MLTCEYCGKTKQHEQLFLGSAPTKEQAASVGGCTWAMECGTGAVHCGSELCRGAAKVDRETKRARVLQEVRS